MVIFHSSRLSPYLSRGIIPKCHHGTEHRTADNKPKHLRKAAGIAADNDGNRKSQKPERKHMTLERWVLRNYSNWVQGPTTTDGHEEKEKKRHFREDRGYVDADIVAILYASGAKRYPRHGDCEPVKLGVRGKHD